MKIGKITTSFIFLLCCFTSCLEDEHDHFEVSFESNSDKLTQEILTALNPQERAQFNDAEFQELKDLLGPARLDVDVRSDQMIEISAGSEDALTDAVALAEEGATILLKAGIHLETGTVMIDKKINLLGEEGAILQTSTEAVLTIGFIQPAVHINGVSGVKIKGIDFQSLNPLGGTAILIEDSPRTQIMKNSFTEHEIGVLVQDSDRAIIASNNFVTSLGWASNPAAPGFGIAVVNGKNARIIGNDITSSVFGVWACDTGGWYMGNATHGNFIGLILCKVPNNSFPLPSGEIIGSDLPANNWLTLYNSSYENLNAGYLVIDGANKNFLSSNIAKDNGSYDIELAGDSERFGFLAPTSAGNRVYSRRNTSVKDCGVDNRVRGGELVDNTSDPCY